MYFLFIGLHTNNVSVAKDDKNVPVRKLKTIHVAKFQLRTFYIIVPMNSILLNAERNKFLYLQHITFLRPIRCILSF